MLRMTALFTLLLLALPGRAIAFDHGAWNELLQAHVRVVDGGHATRVDYAALATRRDELQKYLQRLAEVTESRFDAWAKEEQLAFLINAYNAWTVELVLSRYPKLSSIKDLGSLFGSPWRKPFIPLLGQERSLDDIEQGLIRGSGRYREPRIHFALNCASIGCPALRPEAYRGEALERQLEEAAVLFLGDRSRNRLNGKVLEVSPIFKWYRQDFASGWRGATSLPAFLAIYREALGLDAKAAESLIAGGIDIRFLDYDWQLNAAR